MRIDAFSGIEAKNTQIRSSENVVAGLKEGDTVNVRVISVSENGVNLKTEDGQLIRAKMAGGMSLSPGDVETLMVTGEEDGVVYMARADQVGTQAASRGGADREIHDVLTALRIPVTAETLSAIREIVAQHPELDMETVVFFAANKIPVTDQNLQLVRELLSGEVKIAQVLGEFVEMLAVAMAGDVQETQLTSGGDDANVQAHGVLEETPVIVVDGAETTQTDASNTLPQGENVTSQLEPETIPDVANRISVDGGEPLSITTNEQDVDTRANASLQDAVTGTAMAQIDATETESVASTMRAEDGGEGLVDPMPADSVGAGDQKVVFDMLRQMAVFREVSDGNLADFARALLSDADGLPLPSGDTSARALLRSLEDIFADPAKSGSLQKAREELFARLTFFAEALESSMIPNRAALLEQTQRLINHIRLTDNIDQFVYVQLPINLGGEQKTAELYIYKQKKGAKRIDPDNVKILLSLDLQNMGHLESFIGIRGRDVTISMETENEETAEFFRHATVTLHRMLQEIGFKLADARASKKKTEETTVSTAFVTLAAIESGGTVSGIDCVI